MKIQRDISKYFTQCMLCCLLFLGFAINAYAQDDDAEDEDEGEAEIQTAIYVPLIPAFVVNYGGQGKLKYIKLEVSLRVKDTLSSNSIRHHMPLIRDYLVREFSGLNDVDVDTQQGKELVRGTALEGVKALLLEEDGEEVEITGLYFNTFVVQR